MSWNRPSEEKVKARGEGGQKHVHLKGLLAGVIVVIGAGIAAWWLIGPDRGRGEGAASSAKQTLIKDVKPTAERASNLGHRESQSTNDVAQAADEGPKILKMAGPHKVVEIVKVVTNADFNQIVETVRTDDGRIGEIVREARPRPFSFATDELLALTLCHDHRVATPPLPGSRTSKEAHDRDFYESIKEPIIISKDDSERVAEMKRTVREARIQIKDLMDQGYHFDDILDDYERLSSENREIRNKAMRELKEIRASGDKDAEQQYFEKINAAFENMGIDPLDRPRERKGKKE